MKPNFLFEVLMVCEILGAVEPVECLTASGAVTHTQNLQGIFKKRLKEIALYRVGCELLECDSTAACGSR